MKRIRWCLLIILLFGFPVITLAENTTPEKVVEAERFILRDALGQVKAELLLADGCPEFVMYDNSGEKGVIITLADGEPRITLYNSYSWAYVKLIAANDYEGMSHIPSRDEWLALQMTAWENSSFYALTSKLNKSAFTVAYTPGTDDGILFRISVNTTTQYSWNYHTGLGKFSVSDREVRAAYEEAAQVVFGMLKFYYFYAKPNEVKITFYINTYEVGTWHNGVMKLKGE